MVYSNFMMQHIGKYLPLRASVAAVATQFPVSRQLGSSVKSFAFQHMLNFRKTELSCRTKQFYSKRDDECVRCVAGPRNQWALRGKSQSALFFF